MQWDIRIRQSLHCDASYKTRMCLPYTYTGLTDMFQNVTLSDGRSLDNTNSHRKLCVAARISVAFADSGENPRHPLAPNTHPLRHQANTETVTLHLLTRQREGSRKEPSLHSMSGATPGLISAKEIQISLLLTAVPRPDLITQTGCLSSGN